MIIDPISAYLGSTDSHRDAEVRGLMALLAALAERTGAAILGIMHLAKDRQQPAIYRAVGSIAFAAAARLVLAVAADPDREDRRIVAPIKSNLSTPPVALAYTLTTGRLVWEAEPVADADVDALLGSGAQPTRASRRRNVALRSSRRRPDALPDGAGCRARGGTGVAYGRASQAAAGRRGRPEWRRRRGRPVVVATPPG